MCFEVGELSSSLLAGLSPLHPWSWLCSGLTPCSLGFSPQIIMYLLSRILFGLSRLAVEKGYIPQPRQDPFPLLAALVWGTVLWLFEYHRGTLQPSLQASMTYLYEDSEVWHDLSDFLVYNKRTDSK